MRWINCKECGHEFSSAMSRCPECGKWRLTTKTAVGSIFGLAFVALITVGMIMGFNDDGNGKIDTVSSTASGVTSNTKTEAYSVDSSSESKIEPSISSEESKVSKPQSTVVSSEESEPEVSEKPVTSQVVTPSTPDSDDSYPIGTIIKNDMVYSTVPKFFLDYLYNAFGVENEMTFDEFAYSIKAEDRDYGYTKVLRNKNGNATLVLPMSKLTDTTVKKLTTAIKYVKDTENQKFIKKIGHSEKFDKFEIILNTDELNDEQKANLVLFGVFFLEYQYTTRDGADKCEVTVVYPDSSKETLIFPDIIK